MGNGNSLSAKANEYPDWPGNVTCAPKPSNLLVDAFSTAPAAVPASELSKGTIPNSCTMVCLPEQYKKVAGHHGVHYGSTCFGTADDVDGATYADGSDIPPGTPICPGYEFAQTGKQAGVEWFQYECKGGDAIDFGGKYK